MIAVPDPDGSRLLTSASVGKLLEAAVTHAGGKLLSWRMDHVDSHPQRSTTATYTARIEWDFGQRDELLGVSARVGGPAKSDDRAEIFADGDRELAVWLYPKDPDLPGLARAAYPEHVAEMFNEYRVLPQRVSAEQVHLDMIGYRPRRRAVLRAVVDTGGEPHTFYVKVLRDRVFADVLYRHRMLREVGIPAPVVAAATSDSLLVLAQVPGVPLSRAIFHPEPPCSAEQLIGVLDAMPIQVAGLPRRAPWTEAVQHYASMVTEATPWLEQRIRWVADEVQAGLAGIEPGNEPTHGDFHEGQLHVADSQICGILDVDTIGPGRRVDDLACLIAHLSTVQRMNAEQAERVRSLLRAWVPVFDSRVDPAELRLRSAAVILSLATGPFRGQEPDWQRETEHILGAAETLVRQVR